MSDESFYAIRMAEGELIYGEYGWMRCDGPDDWMVAEDSEHDAPQEYEIVLMRVEPIARRTFGVLAPDDDEIEPGEPAPTIAPH